MPLLDSREEKAIRFAKFYGSDDPKLIRQEIQSFSREDVEEYLDKADLAYQDTRVKILNKLGQEMHMSDVTYTLPPKCLHCSKTAIASCIVEDAEMVLQLVCQDHITGILIWRKEK